MSDNIEYVFAVVMISFDSKNDNLAVEPLSVHTSMKTALEYADELEAYNNTGKYFPNGEVELMYDVLEFKLDEPPMMLDLMKKRKKVLEDSLEEAIIDLMDKGILDQLVGEDGYFYYVLTKKGKEKIKTIKLPAYIKKLIKRKDDI